MIVNSRNTTIWRWNNAHAFDANLPFKDPDNNDQTLEYNPRFPGQYFDKETNLHYNYFRHYESETGRYISPDPMGIAGGGLLGYLSLSVRHYILARSPLRFRMLLQTRLNTGEIDKIRLVTLYAIPDSLATLADSRNVQTTSVVLSVSTWFSYTLT